MGFTDQTPFVWQAPAVEQVSGWVDLHPGGALSCCPIRVSQHIMNWGVEHPKEEPYNFEQPPPGQTTHFEVQGLVQSAIDGFNAWALAQRSWLSGLQGGIGGVLGLWGFGGFGVVGFYRV